VSAQCTMRLGLVALILLTGCQDDPSETEGMTPVGFGPAAAAAGPVFRVTVAGPATLGVGSCKVYSAAGTDFDGQRAQADSGGYTLRPNFNVADVTPLLPTTFSLRDTLLGTVCGKANGFTRVTATLDNVVGNEVPVDVGQPVATVVVTPGTASVRPGATVQLASSAVDQFGTAVGRAAAWTSSAPAIMTVHPTSGLVSGVKVGSATIRATIAGKTGTATVVSNINGGTISGPGVITAPGSYSWTANPVPSGSYTIVWDITTYGNGGHFSRTGNPVTLMVSSATGNIGLMAKAYLGGLYVGNLQPKVVGNHIGGACGGKKC
jgi:hypothetical protein